MSDSPKEAIGVVGVGWVGLVTAACFAKLGHEVWAMDVDEAKVKRLASAEVAIHEPGLPELVRDGAGRLRFTTSMDEVLDAARLLFCCVDTPPTYSGDADLSRVRTVVAGLSGDGDHALVMKSTVPAGTGHSIRREVPGLAYVSCPEFLKEGSAVADFMNPDRVVVGSEPGDEWAADAVAAVYEPLGGELVRTDLSSAEMIKLASNAFLATKISFINEIANVCEEVGADVTEVAAGMGLDERIGPAFLRAGIGYGGSCLEGAETVLVRRGAQVGLRRLEELFATVAVEQDAPEGAEVLRPASLDVLAWDGVGDVPGFHPVSALTRRDYAGTMVELRTKMGRRVRCTDDHPVVVVDRDGIDQRVIAAADVVETDFLPLAIGAPQPTARREAPSLVAAGAASGIGLDDVIVRPSSPARQALGELKLDLRREALDTHPRGHVQRFHDIKRSGALRLDEALALRVSLRDSSVGTARNGTFVPIELDLDEEFWAVAGLYGAEGHVSIDGGHDRHRICWSFHPTDEPELVARVASYWRARGVKADVARQPTSTTVRISSKLLGRWWLDRLRIGRDAYAKRVPDALWGQPIASKRAFLAGLWLGDGSWSFVNRGRNVVLEYGTASRELADGMLRLLGELGIVASQRIGRVAKSTVDTHWLRISGADQVERALFLVGESERREIRSALAGLSKRIAPGGYRHSLPGAATVRVVSTGSFDYRGAVYSLEVPDAGTVVTTGGLVVHNCFPKDVSALKQLAGNTGYHFQLLNSVIEVNELQKRRVIGKLTKHLGSLVGRRIALLGLAFKPDTDDMREASSLVLAARLQGEGASVAAFDPVAEPGAAELLPAVEMCDSAEAALAGADAAVLVTEWPQFSELDWESLRAVMSTPLVVDGRNFLDPDRVAAAGLSYEGIGRPPRRA